MTLSVLPRTLVTRHETGGQVVANEASLLMLPSTWSGDASVVPIVFLHGALGDSLGPLEDGWPNRHRLLSELVRFGGWPILSIDAAGQNTWCNDAMLAALDTAIAWLPGAIGCAPSGVHLIGESMGAAGAMVAAHLRDDILSVAGVIPVTDVDDFYDRDGFGLAGAIDNAWSGDWKANAVLSDRSPEQAAAAGNLDGIPILLAHSTIGGADPATSTAASLFGLDNVTAVDLGDNPHDDDGYAAVDVTDFLVHLSRT